MTLAMIENFQNILVFEVSLREVVANLLMAFIFGLLVSLLYRWTNRGNYFSPTFANSLILLSMITAVAIMIIGNSLARAFGMVGLLSIIRLRTATQDSQEFMFIFFTLAVGLAAGVGSFLVALFGTLFIGLIIIILHARKSVRAQAHNFNLRVFSSSDENPISLIEPVLADHCARFKLMGIRSIGKESFENTEFSFSIRLKAETNVIDLVKTLRALLPVRKVEIGLNE